MKKLIFILISCLAFSLHAEDSVTKAKDLSPDLTKRTVLVLNFVNFSENKTNANLSKVFADSLAIALEESDFLVVPQDGVKKRLEELKLVDADLLSLDSLRSIALEFKADVLLVGFYTVDGKVLYTGVRAYDLFADRLAFANIANGEAGLAVFDTVDSIALSAAAAIRDKLPPLAASEVTELQEKVIRVATIENSGIEIGEVIPITIYSKSEDAEVYSGKILLGRITGGKLIDKGKANTSLNLTVKKKGYFDLTQSFYITKENSNCTFGTMAKNSMFDFSLSFFPHFLPGVMTEVRYFPFGEWVFLTGRACVGPIFLDFPPLGLDSIVPGLKSSVLLGSNLFFNGNFPVRFSYSLGPEFTVIGNSNGYLADLILIMVLRVEYSMSESSLFFAFNAGDLDFISIWKNHSVQYPHTWLQAGYIWKL